MKKPLLFTFPGKAGDNLFRLPVAYQYCKQNSCQTDVCLDTKSTFLVSLFKEQPWVSEVFIDSGIWDWSFGGQPYDFRKDKEFKEQYDKVFHLGYKTSPFGGVHEDFRNDSLFKEKYHCVLPEDTALSNITLIAAIQSGCNIDLTNLLTEASIVYTPPKVEDVCIHIETETPERHIEAKESILRVLDILEKLFPRIWIIASDKNRDSYSLFLKSYKTFLFDDYGDLRQTVKILSKSMLIGTYGCMWALASLMKVKQIVIGKGRGTYNGESWIPPNYIESLIAQIYTWKHSVN